MNPIFEQAFAFTIGNEGLVYTNDPDDSGGPTKFGVTQAAYEAHIGHPLDVSEIKNMTVETAKQFYFERYWKPMACERLVKPAIAMCLFDSAVLYGVGTASILAQKAVSLCGASLKFDGSLGDKSVAALNIVKEEEFLKAFRSFVLQRIDAVIALKPKNEKYRQGWTNRADRLLTLNNIDPLIKGVT